MIGPLVAHIHAPVCDDDSESDDSESESESDSESDDSDDDSESMKRMIVCDGDVCKRSYKEGPRAKGRGSIRRTAEQRKNGDRRVISLRTTTTTKKQESLEAA